MARPNYDGVVEAVRYGSDGQVLCVRVYLRRGPTWSDHVLMDRQALVETIKSGKRFITGRRIPQLAGTFETGTALNVIEENGGQILVTEGVQSDRDLLKGVPLF